MPTATAKIDGKVIASSSSYQTVEGNVYFPPSSLAQDGGATLTTSATHSTCPWKGRASYYNITTADGRTVKDAAWYYPAPKDGAAHIKDYIAFCKFVYIHYFGATRR
ncbi:uncharacterized protein Z519_00694 [Cladophialophora bantiana CBS 173.52]|uniref:DUF427 domain-containing protein n=1 Tax=Cladophialophora bantiana (strain ATCC 10958 / CBS 173.52 / CDC B-1940 / NIH 8579) TaxID=1442370 RepID=A0A0D2FAD7_CLAB1|nr:uncharacterized protein Z519_00694 [Cladophialophora bantiana CBS 173.52]KIW99031.1 hypothetical protein Z519_00694 [Cladophialophora bantiana CBS 173.52]